MRGLLWSHLLASVCGGLVLAGVLLAFGVIGKQRTTTVPVNYATPTPDPGGSTSESNGAQIYARESPAVVFIRAPLTQRVTSPFLAAAEPASAVSTGSGFLIRDAGDQGYLLTTFHTIQGSDYDSGIVVQFGSGTFRRAKVIGYSQPNDVALLKVSMRGVPSVVKPLSLASSQTVSVGDSVLTIANPFGGSQTLSGGIVSSLQGRLTGADGTSINSVIQTDTALTAGMSGSPLLNANGQVIGISDQIQVAFGGARSMVGFAVPINTVRGGRGIIPKGVL